MSNDTSLVDATSATLTARALGHRFSPEGPEVLRDVSMEVRSGEFVAIVGASGCGKTTLLSIIAGLIGPDHGSVWLSDRNVTGVPSVGRASVFQGDRLFPWRTARRNVAFGLELQGVPKKVSRQVLDAARAL